MVRGHGGWLPLPHSRQAKGGGEAICLPPLRGPGPHRPTHGLERPQAWLPAHVEVYEPPGVGLHGRNGPPIPQAHPHSGYAHRHVEGVGQPPDPPASGPLLSWALYVQSCPSLVDTMDWIRPLTFIVRGDAYPSWTQLSIGLLIHGVRGRTPAYLWVIGMAVCGDKDMAAIAMIWAENLQVCGFVNFCVNLWRLISRFRLILTPTEKLT